MTKFPPNPLNYNPSQFGGLTYEELTAKFIALQPLEIPQKPMKKKTHITLIPIDLSPKKKKTPTLPPATPEDEQKEGDDKEEEKQDTGVGSEEETRDRLEVDFSFSRSEEHTEGSPEG